MSGVKNSPFEGLAIPAAKQSFRNIGSDQVRAYWSSRALLSSELKLPTQNSEDWRYTGLGFLNSSELDRPARLDSVKIYRSASEIRGIAKSNLVFIDGHYRDELSVVPQGVKVVVLSELHKHSNLEDKYRSLVERHFKNGISSYFESITTNLCENPIFILVTDEVNSNLGLSIEHISSKSPIHSKTEFKSPVLFIHIDSMTSVSIVEYFHGSSDSQKVSMPTSVVGVNVNSSVEYTKIASEDLRTHHLGNSFFYLDRDSNLRVNRIHVTENWIREDVHVFLQGAGASCSLNSLAYLSESEHSDLHTWIHHQVPDTRSQQLHKAILDGKSRGVFNGAIRIEPNAQRSSSEQLAKSLLLSSQAEIDAKPQLEIFADDVKATHGATVGRLDDEELFYLQSRAVPKALARTILLRAFMDEIIHQIENPNVRSIAEVAFKERLKI